MGGRPFPAEARGRGLARITAGELADEEVFFAGQMPRRERASSSTQMFRASYLPDSVLLRQGQGARHDIEPGCTVAALDYRESRAKLRVKGTAANPVATASGGRRLGAAGN